MKIRYLLFSFIVIVFLGAISPGAVASGAQGRLFRSQPGVQKLLDDASPPAPSIVGPFIETVIPAVYDGDLRELPHLQASPKFSVTPLRYIPGQEPKGSALPEYSNWIDPVVQDTHATSVMPALLTNFLGMTYQTDGSGYPPDTVGDVGETHYVQAVNTSIAVYDKSTGNELLRQTFNEFFSGLEGTPCDNSNQGDPVVLYDPIVKRWLVSDFAWEDLYTNGGPYYECIAVSQGEDPVSGGWYFYALRADTGALAGYLNDYPKLGVWADGWYMSANMFRIVSPNPYAFAVRVWALDREAMISGQPLTTVYFDLCQYGTCDSLLPANLRGDLPPLSSPEYFLSAAAPEYFYLWKFSVDWDHPANSTFTGPAGLNAAPFAIGSSVPQPGLTSKLLDSLSYRLMMQLQYRNIDGEEALWANHSVASGGVVGVRWYEINGLDGTPMVAQQGTYQPDSTYRWMGALAVDQDGNMAVGYSVSSTSTYPGIRYAGRLAGEEPEMLTQDEAVLYTGSGSQLQYTRWGDYSAMTVDPVDDCTFWYTTEYYATTGTNWQTRVGSFRFPSCGLPKGNLAGQILNAVTLQSVPDAWVVAQANTLNLAYHIRSDAAGVYTMTLPSGTYTVTAGPLLPGYPLEVDADNVTVTTDAVTDQYLFLQPSPYLAGLGTQVLDEDGYVEPGDVNVPLLRSVENTGALTATTITSQIYSLTEGVQIQQPLSSYPDVAEGEIATNNSPYIFSISRSVPCGADMDFRQVITDTTGVYQNDFSLNASVPLPRQDLFYNTVESVQTDWTTGGVSNNSWGITDQFAYSPTHAWTDSPNGDYANSTNSYLRSTSYDLTGKREVRVSGWVSYTLEIGWDFAYLEYSLNEGLSWMPTSLASFNGHSSWTHFAVTVPQMNGQPAVAIRIRIVTDGSITADGIYVDDLAISYESFTCDVFNFFLPLVLKDDSP